MPKDDPTPDRACLHCGYRVGAIRDVRCPECGEHLLLPPPYRKLAKLRPVGLWGMRASALLGIAFPGAALTGLVVEATHRAHPLVLFWLLVYASSGLGFAIAVLAAMLAAWRSWQRSYKDPASAGVREVLLWSIALGPWVFCVLLAACWGAAAWLLVS